MCDALAVHAQRGVGVATYPEFADLEPSRRVWAVIRASIGWALLATALLLQLVSGLSRLDRPNIDGRLHRVWENVRFTTSAIHSLTPPPPGVASASEGRLRGLGTAEYAFDAEGRISDLRFYSHHPVLSPTVYRAWTALFGFGDRSPRSLMLLGSLAASVVLFGLLRAGLRGTPDGPAWAGGLTLLHAAFPLPYTFVEVWKYENFAHLALLTSLWLLPVDASPGRLRRTAFLTSLVVLYQTDWNVYFAAPLLLWPLVGERSKPGGLSLLGAAVAATLAGVLLNFALLYLLGFDIARMQSQGSLRMSGGLIGFAGWLEWAAGQANYFHLNFGASGIAVAVGSALVLIRQRDPAARRLVHAGLTCALSGIAWLVVFRNLSHIHHFVQWSLGPALVLLAAAAIRSLPGLRAGALRGAAVAGLAALIVWGVIDARRLETDTDARAFGTAADLETIGEFGDRRILIGSRGESGPPDWWENPVIAALQDPLVRGTPGPAGRVLRIDLLRSIDPERDIAAARRREDAVRALEQRLEARTGPVELVAVATSPSFAFFRVEPEIRAGSLPPEARPVRPRRPESPRL